VTRLGHRPALDGVRGLAIVPVVTLHALNWPHEGSLGVDLFFVLSGFLITTLLLEERAVTGTISFRAFYRRRAARLVPGLFAMLAIYELATSGAHPWAVLFGATYTLNIANVVDPQAIPLSLGHLWSLAQEEQFYLIWPPLLLLIVRRRPALLTRVISTAIALVLLEKTILLANGASLTRIYHAPDTHADPILIGCLFGAIYAAGRGPAVGRFAPLALATVAGVILASQWTNLINAESPLRPAFSIACGFLILAAVDGRPSPLLARPLRFLGRISYSLYLWHAPVLASAGVTSFDVKPVRAALAISASVAVATASFYLVERPLRARWREARVSLSSTSLDASVAAVQPGRP
jgi:peptidoglycan/LPS O-acetylase OafA/YrhL